MAALLPLVGRFHEFSVATEDIRACIEFYERLGFTQAGLAEIMGVSPGRVSQIERGEVATVEALATYVAALGGKLELVADIGGHLLKMPASPAA